MYLFAKLGAAFAGWTSRTCRIGGAGCEDCSTFKGVRVASGMILRSGQAVLTGGVSTGRNGCTELTGAVCSASIDIRSLAIKIDFLSGQEGLMGGGATRMLLRLSELGLSGLGSVLKSRSSTLR